METKNSKKFLKLIFGFIIIVSLILLTVFFGNRYIAQQQSLAQEALQPAEKLLQEAQTLLNQDIIGARDKTSEAIELILTEQKTANNQTFTKSLFEKKLTEAKEFFDQISGMIEVAQLETFIDLREYLPNFLISSLDFENEKLVLLDQELKQLIMIDTNTKEVVQLTQNLPTFKDLTVSPDKIYLLGEGLHELNLATLAETDQLTNLKTEGDSDREAIFIDYYQDYLYIFNPEKRNIYRFIIRNNGLSEPIGWLTNKQNIKFDQINSFVVDGRIWLAEKNGTIHKLERGEPVTFALNGLDDGFNHPIKLYANLDTSYLYVLDPANSRLVLLSHQGDFIKQIVSPSLKSVTNLAVNEVRQQAYLVSGSIIYLIELSDS